MPIRQIRKAFGFLGAPTCVEDVTDLLNNSLLVSALMLAFTVTLATGTFGHQDLVEADTRFAQYIQGKEGHTRFLETTSAAELYENNSIISVTFIHKAVQTSVLLTIALVITMLTYVSLAFSDCRENPEFFKHWFKLFRFPIALSYLMVLFAMIEFANLNHAAIDIVYPWYNVDHAYDNVTGSFISDAWSSGKGEYDLMIEGGPYNDQSDDRLIRTHPHNTWPFYLKRTQETVIIALVCGVIVVHLTIYLWHACTTGTSDTVNKAMRKRKMSARKDDPGVIKAANADKLKAAGIDAELMKDTHDLLLDAALKDAGIDKPGDRLRLIRDAREGRLSADM